jgi:hypothetical protein
MVDGGMIEETAVAAAVLPKQKLCIKRRPVMG